VCLESGVGAGGGFDLDLAGGAAETGGTAFAEATAKFGLMGGTIGGELDLGCMNGKLGTKVMAGMYQAGVDTTGAVSVGMGQNDLPMPGFKLEGKIGLKYCQKF
jgi:hypothetical protein